MKPISVTMCAFGSYNKETTIDFTDIPENFFLISGDTGSGKTTMFDAITFALFGKGSGSLNERKGEVFQSRCSDYKTTPYVKFIFNEAGKIYEIYRSPAHVFDGRKTGIGETLIFTLPDGSVCPGQKKEVEARIQKTIGLDYNQFMKVAMIAQSEFVKLINEGTKSKKEAFRMLFGTEIYQKLVDSLLEKSKEYDKKIVGISKECAGIVSNILIPTTIDNYAEVENLRTLIKSGNLGKVDEFLSAISELIINLKNEEKNAEGEVNKLQAEKEKTLIEKTEADALLKAFSNLSEAKARIELLNEEENSIKENKHLADKILSSYAVKNDFDLYEKNCDALEKATEEFESLKIKQPKIEDALNKVKAELEKCEKSFNDETSKFSVVEITYNDAIKQLEDIANLNYLISQIKNDIETASSEVNIAKGNQEQFETEYLSKSTERDELTKKLLEYANLESKLTVLKGYKEQITSIITKLDELRCEELTIEDKKHKADELSAVSVNLRQKYDNAKMRRDKSISGIIAGELVPGCACPVCGSKEHPSPCVLENEEDARIDLDAFLNDFNKASSKFTAAYSEYETLEKKYDEDKEKVDLLFISFKSKLIEDGYDITSSTLIETVEELIDSNLSDVETSISDKKELEDNLNTIKTFITNAEDRRNVLLKEYEDKKSLVSELENKCLEAETKLKGINPKYKDINEAQSSFNDAKATRDAAELAYKLSEKNNQKINKEYTENKTLLAHYEKLIPDLKADCENALNKYNNSLEDLKLTEEFWKDTVMKYSKESAEIYQAEYTEFLNKQSKAVGALEEATKATEGKSEPDLDIIVLKLNSCEEKIGIACEELESIRINCSSIQTAYSNLVKKNNENSDLVSNYEKINGLYKKFAGKNSGDRMDIETFVQRYYLENILASANTYYRKMTNDEYELRMTSIEEAGDGGNKGLDLLSYSRLYNRTNEISSLSGGESFMAALAIAIGMADQITMSSHINLDMMFIDEGFGSLSEQNRKRTIDMLKELAGGEKLIGIISHVTELKREIDSKLLVTKTEDGSHIKWEK